MLMLSAFPTRTSLPSSSNIGAVVNQDTMEMVKRARNVKTCMGK